MIKAANSGLLKLKRPEAPHTKKARDTSRKKGAQVSSGSNFAPSSTDDSFSLLAMREYVVYHTNQAYPQYVVHVELV